MSIQGGTWQIFHELKKRLANKEIDLDSDTFKCALLTSAYAVDLAAQKDLADISANEVAEANGYPAGGVALANPALALAGGGALTWDADNVVFTADGGSITARRAVIYDDSHASKALVAVCLLDESDADITAPDGVSIGVTIDTIFSLE